MMGWWEENYGGRGVRNAAGENGGGTVGKAAGKRGTTNQNLVEENFINFQISLSLTDRWFVKRKYD